MSSTDFTSFVNNSIEEIEEVMYRFGCHLGRENRKKNGEAIQRSGASPTNLEHQFIRNLKISRESEERGEGSQGAETYPMREAIKAQRYDLVHSNLQNKICPIDPNEEIHFDTVYMTGLEYAIYKGDWKMAILFFVNSADPAYNCFDGTILKYSRSEGRYVHSHCHTAFLEDTQSKRRRRRKFTTRIAGFDGLHCLVNRRCKMDKVMSSLWLMKQAYENDEISIPPKPIIETICITRRHISNIDCQDIWNAKFCTMIRTCLLCFRTCINEKNMRLKSARATKKIRKGKLPNDVSIHILEYIIDDILCEVIQEVLRGTALNAIKLSNR